MYLGILGAAIAGLLSAWLFLHTGDKREVLVVRNTIHRGDIIRAQDITVAQISVDPVMTAMPASAEPQILGKRAALDMTAGSSVTSTAISTDTFPAAGQALVGLNLTASQMPSTGIKPGDTITIVYAQTTNQNNGNNDTATTTAKQYPGTVIDVTDGGASSATTIVDATVNVTDAAEITTLASGGHVAIYVTAPTGH